MPSSDLFKTSHHLDRVRGDGPLNLGVLAPGELVVVPRVVVPHVLDFLHEAAAAGKKLGMERVMTRLEK